MTFDEEIDNFFFMIDFRQLRNILKYSLCPSCTANLQCSVTFGARMGFNLPIILNCLNCNFSETFSTSKQYKSDSYAQPFDVNIRAVMAFREMGSGREAMETFAAVMNMPPPVQHRSYNNIVNMLHGAFENSALESKKNAVCEVREKLEVKSNDEVLECGVSIDGTWQRCEFASLNGVVAAVALDNNKVIDTYVMSKYCKGGQKWDRRKDHPSFNDWKAIHYCSINHEGSAGSMESAGAIEIFSSFVPNYKLRYTEYLGDDDTSSYKNVVKSKPYEDDVERSKLECIGHWQKRTGNQCRELRKDWKGKENIQAKN